jgi:hypothetical protein
VITIYLEYLVGSAAIDIFTPLTSSNRAKAAHRLNAKTIVMPVCNCRPATHNAV